MTAQTSPSFSADEFWIADSSASHHMTNNVTQLAQVAPYTTDEKITVGNGEGLCIAHVGNAYIPSISGSFPLNQVYHVPQLTDKATKALLYKGRSNKGLYPIPQALGDLSIRSSTKSSPIVTDGIASTPTALLGKPVSSVLWHQRFGHVSNEVLTQMLKQSQISSRLHSDVWGPSSSVAFGGYRYYVSIIDDYFMSLCQQNGVAERKNRHIIETTITLLATAALNDKFWYYAGAHAAFLINRMPCQLLQMTSTYFKLFGHNPELQSLKVFGSAVYPLLRPYNSHKLEPRSAKHVFLRYSLGYKGVSCFHPNTYKVVISRHVIHDETQFPMKNCSVSSTQSSSVMTQLSSSAIAVSLPHRYVTTTETVHSLLPCSNENSSSSVSTYQAQEVLGSAQTMQPIWILLNYRFCFLSLSQMPLVLLLIFPFHNMVILCKLVLKVVLARIKILVIFNVSTCLSTITALDEPHTFREASTKSEWQQAMTEEIQALQTQARLVAQGFSQEQGIDFDETFSPGPRAWNAKFTGYLPALGFVSSHSDPSLFAKHDGRNVVILLLYVDDIIITGSSSTLVQSVIDDLGQVFDMKDIGQLTYFLGLEVSYQSNGDLFVNQAKYAHDLLKKAGMETCKPSITPCKPHCHVLTIDGTLPPDPTMFRSLVGALQYLTFARPDLAYVVNTVCQFMTAPTDIHMTLVKCILTYVQGTLSYGLTFTSGSSVLVGYSDADWAGDPSTRRSTTGFVLQDLHSVGPEALVLHSDNLSTLALSSNPVLHSRIKHLELDFHFIRERVQRHDLVVRYVNTEDQVADIFTKGLHSPLFLKHSHNLSVGPATTAIEGG
ncbi:PREDICTED: uncharacterized protein LOC107881145 [Prunus mume]|uniref:Uncharacterized protein LOC107881145 n=1 Tax=Prunus mume TaxID=102107 RepID=A0ABM1LQR3_PRUMU|nr:PREDICTED: uncharacterized protein LOC107881145 [Prunus mume]